MIVLDHCGDFSGGLLVAAAARRIRNADERRVKLRKVLRDRARRIHAQLALRREDLERNRLRTRLTGLREDVVYGIHNAAFYHVPSSVSLALLIITTQAFPSSVIPGTEICFIQKATYLPTRLPGGSSNATQQASSLWQAFVNAILPINMSPSPVSLTTPSTGREG